MMVVWPGSRRVPPVAAGDAAGGEAVLCTCGVPCTLRTSNSPNNPGRQFHACDKAREASAGFL